MTTDQLIEERPEMNHRLAQILGARLATSVTDDNLARRAVVVDHGGMFDREIFETVFPILDRVTACAHDIFDEPIRLIHGSTRVIDEPRLNRAPRLCILIRFVAAQRPQRERLYTALALHQFALNLRRCFGRLQKAVVFRTETRSQSRSLPPPDEQPHDDCDQRRNDYDCEPHLRLLIHGCHLVHFDSSRCVEQERCRVTMLLEMMPDWLEPMAATLTEERFSGPDWLFERKFDGIRLLAYKRRGNVELFSRNHLPQALPAIASPIAQLPPRELILDGEMTWDGREYHVFDILWLDGRDVTRLPLEERHALLEQLPLKAPLLRVERLEGDRPWERACREGWEGVIAKRRGSPYEHRRSKHWLKMKCEASQELVVGGFTDPQGARVGLGALLVGYFERDDFFFAGKVGTGFDTKLLLDLRSRLDKIEQPAPPFTTGTGLPRVRTHWVRPEIVVQVSFIEWTAHGKLRHPRLIGVRFDKKAREVTREQR
jgi:ATP dependent DNA ligase-like protein